MKPQREIKFRAWDKENKIMVYDFQQNIPELYKMKLGDSIHSLVYSVGLCYHSLMQYTGLKDKNGKDIIEAHNNFKKHPVYFENGMFMWFGDPLTIDMDDNQKIHLPSEWAVVIGNIYENTNLINP